MIIIIIIINSFRSTGPGRTTHLQGRVHEAGVAQITEPTEAGLGLGVSVVVGGAVRVVAPQPVPKEFIPEL